MGKVKDLIEETIEIERTTHFSESSRFRQIMKILDFEYGISYSVLRVWQKRLKLVNKLKMKNFIPASEKQAQEITSAIAGKVVESVSLYDNRGDDFLEITFTDGSRFKIRYDWIYEWGAG